MEKLHGGGGRGGGSKQKKIFFNLISLDCIMYFTYKVINSSENSMCVWLSISLSKDWGWEIQVFERSFQSLMKYLSQLIHESWYLRCKPYLEVLHTEGTCSVQCLGTAIQCNICT